MSYKFPIPCKRGLSQLVEMGPIKQTSITLKTANDATNTGMFLALHKGGTSIEDQEEADKAADFVVKAINLHELLVAVVECEQALDIQVNEGRAVLEKYGWDYSDRDNMNASHFVRNLRKKALAKLKE